MQYADDTVDVEVIRDGEHVLIEDLRRQTYTAADGSSYVGFGLTVGAYAHEATLPVKLQYTWYTALDFVQLVWFSLAQLVTGGATMQDLSGPVGIVSAITEVGNDAPSAGVALVPHLLFRGAGGGKPGGDEPAAHPCPGRRTHFSSCWWMRCACCCSSGRSRSGTPRR